MSRFVVLGASGVIGRRLVTALRNAGEEVWTPARGDTEIFSRRLGHVIYAIGVTADFRTRPFDAVQAHVCTLTNFLRKAEFDSFLYLSSTRVYSGANKCSEDTLLQVRSQEPSDLYNLSKLMGESICFSSGHKEVRVARLANVVGGDDPHSTNFLPTLWREAQAGKILLQSTLTSKKDYIHIDDVVNLIPRIATHGQHKLYNVASGIQISHGQWVDYFKELTGCTVQIATNAAEIFFAPIDVTRVCGEFGFVPRPLITALPTCGDIFGT
jgi:nucleoside-diphosphate-sugar epimerase